MKISNEDVLKCLGSTVINIEISDEQLNVIRKLCEYNSKILAKSDNDVDYIFNNLFIINCKKSWATSLMKYTGKILDGVEVDGKNIYDSALCDEKNFITLLKILNEDKMI